MDRDSGSGLCRGVQAAASRRPSGHSGACPSLRVRILRHPGGESQGAGTFRIGEGRGDGGDREANEKSDRGRVAVGAGVR